MMTDEFTKALIEDGWLGVAKSTPASLWGVGVQTYEPKKKKTGSSASSSTPRYSSGAGKH
jgi:hypothetical protein